MYQTRSSSPGKQRAGKGCKGRRKEGKEKGTRERDTRKSCPQARCHPSAAPPGLCPRAVSRKRPRTWRATGAGTGHMVQGRRKRGKGDVLRSPSQAAGQRSQPCSLCARIRRQGPDQAPDQMTGPGRQGQEIGAGRQSQMARTSARSRETLQETIRRDAQERRRLPVTPCHCAPVLP